MPRVEAVVSNKTNRHRKPRTVAVAEPEFKVASVAENEGAERQRLEESTWWHELEEKRGDEEEEWDGGRECKTGPLYRFQNLAEGGDEMGDFRRQRAVDPQWRCRVGPTVRFEGRHRTASK